MILRRWVVHQYTALPEPDDLVKTVAGPFFLRRTAEAWIDTPGMNRWTINQFMHIMSGHMGFESKARLSMNPQWYRTFKKPNKLLFWRTRRILRRLR